MTIDVGYAHLEVPGGEPIDFVDVPGHDRLVGNMLVGAGEIDAAMLVVAADDGPRPQTLEHLELLDALGIDDGIVVITKADLVDAATLASGRRRSRALIASTRLAAAPILAVSAATGARHRRAPRGGHRPRRAGRPRPRARRPTRLAIDRAFAVRGRGAVVTGSLRGGAIERNDVLRLEPGSRDVRVREVQAHGDARRSCGRWRPGRPEPRRDRRRRAGPRAGARDAGRPSSPTRRLLVALSPGAGPRARASCEPLPAHGERLRLHAGTDQAGAIVVRNARTSAELEGGGATALLRLDRPIAAVVRRPVRAPAAIARVDRRRRPDPRPAAAARSVSRRRATPDALGRRRRSVAPTASWPPRSCGCTAPCRSRALAALGQPRRGAQRSGDRPGPRRCRALPPRWRRRRSRQSRTTRPRSRSPPACHWRHCGRRRPRAAPPGDAGRLRSPSRSPAAVIDGLSPTGSARRRRRSGAPARSGGGAAGGRGRRHGACRGCAVDRRTTGALRGRARRRLSAGGPARAPGVVGSDRPPRARDRVRPRHVRPPCRAGAADGGDVAAQSGRVPRRDRHQPPVRPRDPRGPRSARPAATDARGPRPGAARPAFGGRRVVSAPGSRVTGIVLAGGRSTRFGRDKLAAEHAGRRHAARSRRRRPRRRRRRNRGRGRDRGARAGPRARRRVPVRVVHDPQADGGPLVGLAAGLETAPDGDRRRRRGRHAGPRARTCCDSSIDEVAAGAAAAALEEGGRRRPLPCALDRSAGAGSGARGASARAARA